MGRFEINSHTHRGEKGYFMDSDLTPEDRRALREIVVESPQPQYDYGPGRHINVPTDHEAWVRHQHDMREVEARRAVEAATRINDQPSQHEEGSSEQSA